MSHGTPLRYGHGCRCTQCSLSVALRDQELKFLARMAAARRQVECQKARQVIKADRLRTGELAVTCWCEARIVYVNPEAVQAGRTGSCGLPECNEDRVA